MHKLISTKLKELGLNYSMLMTVNFRRNRLVPVLH